MEESIREETSGSLEDFQKPLFTDPGLERQVIQVRKGPPPPASSGRQPDIRQRATSFSRVLKEKSSVRVMSERPVVEEGARARSGSLSLPKHRNRGQFREARVNKTPFWQDLSNVPIHC